MASAPPFPSVTAVAAAAYRSRTCSRVSLLLSFVTLPPIEESRYEDPGAPIELRQYVDYSRCMTAITGVPISVAGSDASCTPSAREALDDGAEIGRASCRERGAG